MPYRTFKVSDANWWDIISFAFCHALPILCSSGARGEATQIRNRWHGTHDVEGNTETLCIESEHRRSDGDQCPCLGARGKEHLLLLSKMI
jgi:hypothetical protein